MPGEIKKTEQEPIQLSAADQQVIAFAAKEEAEADRILAEALGKTPEGEGKTPEEEAAEQAATVKAEADKEAEAKKGEKEAVVPDDNKGLNPKTDEDLLAELTVENAKKRISAAQSKMHETNKELNNLKNTSTEEATRLAKENADLRLLIEQASTTPEADKAKAEQLPDATVETDGEIEKGIEAIKAEYPEIGEPMIQLLKRQQTQNKILTDKLNGIEDREIKREAVAKETADNAHLTAVADAHPDYMEIANEPLLDEWIGSLPVMERIGAQAIRKGGETNDVIELLTTFKKENGYTLPDKENEKTPADSKIEKAKKMSTPSFKKAKEVNMVNKKVKFTQEEISKWTEKEWAANEHLVDAALADHAVV
jgi:hypothetical protein